jgi:rhomboid protease GluP
MRLLPLIVGLSNGLTIGTSLTCASYLYRFHWRRASAPPRLVATTAIVAATCLMFVLQLARPETVTWLQRDIESLKAGEWWRLLTPLFVQPFGWSQFFFNLVFLAALLPLVERFYGSWVWAVFFVTGLAGQLANYAWLREGGGSSTAAFGLMGAQMAYLLWQRARMAKQYVWLAVLGICGATVMSLIRDGHGPGFVTGVMMGALIIRLSRRGLPNPGYTESAGPTLATTTQ